MNIDGQPGEGGWTNTSLLAALGFTFLGKPGVDPYVSFSWETNLPRDVSQEFRPLQRKDAYLGFDRWRDRWWYYWLSNGYTAYDQLFTAVDHSYDGWYPPPPWADEIATGAWPQFTIVLAPLNLVRGQKTNCHVRVVGGENVHVNPNRLSELLGIRNNPKCITANWIITELDDQRAVGEVGV